jgi:thiopurine S-methyltransferase
MQADFWHQRWSSNQIGFHEPEVNPLLVMHLDALDLSPGARIFLPLCGKTLDIDWLLSRGYRVAGVELSPLAVAQLFERLGIAPTVGSGALAQWSAPGIDVFVGDFFALSAAVLGAVDAVYDRAAMIALPPDMRRRYATQMHTLAHAVPQLLVTLDYEQVCMAGPPFAVRSEEIQELHGHRECTLLATHEVPGGLKGKCPASEKVWRLR